jgi:hypothetical protein
LKKILIKLCYAMCAVMLLFHLNACKDPVVTDKGNTLNFQNINLFHIDTCSVVINTVPDRPIISSSVSTGTLGSMNDIFFGNTFAGIYAQCLLSVTVPTGFVGGVLDSAVLIMPFASTTAKYGKCDKPVDIVVYEVSQDMIPGNTYYTNNGFGVYGQPIGIRTGYVPDLSDSVHFIDPTQVPIPIPYAGEAPMLRVRLSNAFGNKLLNTSDSILEASVSFIEYFKGIFITTNPSRVGDGLMYFNLANNSCNINMYYHVPANSIPDTTVFQFSISNYGVTDNHWDHYYSGTLVQNTLSNPNPNGDKVGYVQGGGGTKLKVRLPTLKNLPPNIGITKAELIMPILDTLLADPSYSPPPSLTLYRIDDKDSLENLSPDNNSGVAQLTTRVDNNNLNYLCYVFNLTEYLQRVLDGYYSNNNGYYIGYPSATAGNRVVILNNPAKLSTQCKLKITYTKLQ